MNVQLFGAVSSPAVANFSLHWTAESGRAEFGDEAANFIPRNFYVDDDLTSVPFGQEQSSYLCFCKVMTS